MASTSSASGERSLGLIRIWSAALGNGRRTALVSTGVSFVLAFAPTAVLVDRSDVAR
jgi:hypothetical protein